MTRAEELWLIEELGYEAAELSPASELLEHDRALCGEELGLRALLERPETLSATWLDAFEDRRSRGRSGKRRRHGHHPGGIRSSAS